MVYRKPKAYYSIQSLNIETLDDAIFVLRFLLAYGITPYYRAYTDEEVKKADLMGLLERVEMEGE